MLTPKQLVWLLLGAIAFGLAMICLSGCATAPKPVVKQSLTTPPIPQYQPVPHTPLITSGMSLPAPTSVILTNHIEFDAPWGWGACVIMASPSLNAPKSSWQQEAVFPCDGAHVHWTIPTELGTNWFAVGVIDPSIR